MTEERFEDEAEAQKPSYALWWLNAIFGKDEDQEDGDVEDGQS